jgi:hypothetical protein|tara:strand:- start:253 stop:507 length:255 start_codon:yes stop_codon:yes gene_type:complete
MLMPTQLKFDLAHKEGGFKEGTKLMHEDWIRCRTQLRKEKRVLVAELDNGGNADELLAKIQHLNDLIESYKPLDKLGERSELCQ